MLLLKSFIVLCILLLSACNGFNNYFNKKSAVVKNDSATNIETKQNNKITADNTKYIKDKITQTKNCSDINLDNISTTNFSFTKEIVQCLESSPEFYNYVLFLYKHNSKKADKQLQKFITTNSKETLPLNSIVSIADKKVLIWLNRKSDVVEPNIIKPELNKTIEKIVLKQGEFETLEDFNVRVANKKEMLQRRIQLEQAQYKAKLEEYYRLQEAYILSLRVEKEDRREQSKVKYLDFLAEEIINILGYPYFEDLVYDPNDKVFRATLLSTKSDWHEYVIINVPLLEAKIFKESIKEIRPVLDFDINDNGELYVSNIIANFDKQNYNAKIVKHKKYKLKSETIEATFGDWL